MADMRGAAGGADNASPAHTAHAPGAVDPAAAPTAPRDKWEQYYAADPRGAPWDTHAVSSQLRAFLLACPARPPAASTETARDPGEALETACGTGEEGESGPGSDGGNRMRIESVPTLHVCPACLHLRPWSAALEPSQGSSQLNGCGNGADGEPNMGPRGGPRVSHPAQPRPPAAADSARPPPPPPLALELCCGTGASLAFLHRLGFSVTGVELVGAACQLAAQRLGDVSGGAPAHVERISSPSSPSSYSYSVPAAAAATITTDTSGALQTHTAGAGSEISPEQQRPRCPSARLLHGDLFAARLPAGSFDLAYDCQGLHAMPPALRPAYVGVLRAALRQGGLLLLLVGRREADGEAADEGGKEGDAGNEQAERCEEGLEEGGVGRMAAAQACGRGREAAPGAEAQGQEQGGTRRLPPQQSRQVESPAEDGAREHAGELTAGGCGGGAGSGGAGGAGRCAGSRGPSLLSRGELRALFPEDVWEALWCRPSRFDLTPAYAAMPRPPPAWCVLLRKR